MSSETSILQLAGIHKSFGPIHALAGVTLEAKAGEVHGLIGENGAGKSTLMKILSGVHLADKGTMYLEGSTYSPSGPMEARELGVSMIYQELNLAPHLTVEENIMLGLEESRFGLIASQRDLVASVLERLGQTASIQPDDRTSSLSIGKQQLVEVGRALAREAKIIVMDEPTSSLSAADSEILFEVVRRLRADGVCVIYISHFLEEILDLCDSYTVLRDGHTVATGNIESATTEGLIEAMVGRSVDELYPASETAPGEVLMTVSNVSGLSGLPKDASFELRRGEIAGIAGLVGSGRSETVRSIFGLDPSLSGDVAIGPDKKLKIKGANPAQSLAAGLDLLSEDRKSEGLAVNMTLRENTTLSGLTRYRKGWLLDTADELSQSESWLNKLKVKSGGPDQPVSSLSGGNQQKVCLARLLHHGSEILFMDEPTRGVDIGSKSEIYLLMRQLAASGKAIVMISSYLPELLGMCDTIMVMHRGQLSEKAPVDSWTEKSIMAFATGGKVE